MMLDGEFIVDEWLIDGGYVIVNEWWINHL